MGRTNYGGVNAEIRAGLFKLFSSALNQGMPAILTTVTIFFWSCAKERSEIAPRIVMATATPKSFNVSRLFMPSRCTVQAENQSISARAAAIYSGMGFE